MDFIIEMRRIAPALKLRSIQAKDIAQAQTYVIAVLVEYCGMDPHRYRIIPVEMTGMVRNFRIAYKTKSYSIRIFPA